MPRSREALDGLATVLVDCAYRVHSALGPGLLESAYAACLAHELRSRRVDIRLEVPVPVHYRGLDLPVGYRMDLLVGGEIIVENKSVQAVLPVHEAQLLTYLKLSGLTLGFLINWNVPVIRNGIRRMVWGF